jgi:hypothetical protein
LMRGGRLLYHASTSISNAEAILGLKDSEPLLPGLRVSFPRLRVCRILIAAR